MARKLSDSSLFGRDAFSEYKSGMGAPLGVRTGESAIALEEKRVGFISSVAKPGAPPTWIS